MRYNILVGGFRLPGDSLGGGEVDFSVSGFEMGLEVELTLVLVNVNVFFGGGGGGQGRCESLLI